MRGSAAAAARCWGALGGADGLAHLVRRSGLLGGPHAAATLDAIVAFATDGRDGGPGAARRRTRRWLALLAAAAAAAAAARRFASSRRCGRRRRGARRRRWRSRAAASSTPPSIDSCSCAHSFPPKAMTTAAGSGAEASAEAAELRSLALRLASGWSAAADLRLLIDAAARLVPARGGGGGDGRLRVSCDRGWCETLAEIAAAAGSSLVLPYLWLRPGGGRLRYRLPDRAWPPAAGYSVACWVRRLPPKLRSGLRGMTAWGPKAPRRRRRRRRRRRPPRRRRRARLPSAFGRLCHPTGGRARAFISMRASSSCGRGRRRRRRRGTCLSPSAVACGAAADRPRETQATPASTLAVFVDGLRHFSGELAYPALDCAHEVHLSSTGTYLTLTSRPHRPPPRPLPPRPPPPPPQPPGSGGISVRRWVRRW